MMTPNERDNGVRWRRDGGGHVESFFLKLNDPASQRALWLKYAILQPVAGAATGELWAVFFPASGEPLAWKRRHGIEDVALERMRPGLCIGPAEFGTGRASGSLEDDSDRIEWELAFDTGGAPFRPLALERLHDTALPSFKLCSPYPDVTFRGTVRVDGDAIDVTGWRGMQGHIWGRRHGVRYAWAHCNLFDDAPPESFFEGFGGRIKFGRWTSPFISRTHLRVGGIDLPFWSLRTLFNSRIELDYHRWAFTSRAGRWRMEGVLEPSLKGTVLLECRDPDGSTAYCINSKVARCELKLYRAGQLERVLESPGGAALDVLVREPDHGLPIAFRNS